MNVLIMIPGVGGGDASMRSVGGNALQLGCDRHWLWLGRRYCLLFGYEENL